MKAGQTGACAAPMEAGLAEECPVSRRAVNALAILGTNIDSLPSLRVPWGMAHSATYFAGGRQVLQAAVYVETLSLAVEAPGWWSGAARAAIRQVCGSLIMIMSRHAPRWCD